MRRTALVRRIPGTAVIALAIFLGLAGTGFAVSRLPKHSVGSAELKDKAVTTTKLRDGSVTASKLAADALVAGPRGPRGPEGPAGPTGPRGADAPQYTDGWHRFDYESGFADFSSGYETGEYRKEPGNIVRFRGLITRATGLPDKDMVIATLPKGYRPNSRRLLATASSSAGSAANYQLGRIDVRPDGSVLWIAGYNSSETDWTSLDNLTFETD